MVRQRMLWIIVGLLMSSGTAWAQTGLSGAIAGVVRDTSGAVMPGVTVEATSPALIEKVRTVVTDGEGRYNIVELRPGTYDVTFTLPGFNAFKREGIQLTAGFSAGVNAELRVGALEETVTVTGATPVVDVQNVRSQSVLSRDVLDTLPTGRTIQGYAALTPGVTNTSANMQDVGGNKGDQFGAIVAHGGRTYDGTLNFEGMKFNNTFQFGGGSARFWVPNVAAVTEVVIETSGMSAETITGGVTQNSVPKDGGNRFSVYFSTSGMTDAMQNSNLTERLEDRGVRAISKSRKIYDLGFGIGGPIKKDKLWFYTAHRWWGSQEYASEVFYNATQGTPVYTADRSRQGYTDYFQRDYSARLTWQAAQRHKLAAFFSNQRNCMCRYLLDNGGFAPEAGTNYLFAPDYLAMATWTFPATNRLLFEAGGANMHNKLNSRRQPGITEDMIHIVELSNNFGYNASPGGLAQTGLALSSDGVNLSQHNERLSMSYVTGTHSFKAGLSTLFGIQDLRAIGVNKALHYRFNLGVPAQLIQWASPVDAKQLFHELGFYAQDQWAMGRMTLNLGARFDYLNAKIPEQDKRAGVFVPALHIDEIKNVPSFTDFSPRLGLAYDLFGTGKTAIKASAGRYLVAIGASIAFAVNPALALVGSSTRTWADANRNFEPDCNLNSFEPNGECGGLDNRAFGTVRPALRYAKDVLEGFGNREYNWQTSVAVQHELRPGTGVTVGYYRTWFGNFLATDNLAVTPADFDPYCITAPVDARLPGGGGYQVCNLADVKPAKFGLVDNLVTNASNFGDDRKEQYDGIDANFNSRLGNGVLLQGGMSFGRLATRCVVVDAPVQFCEINPPFFRPEFKFAGIYPLPLWGLQTSWTLQLLPGQPIGTTTATAASAVVTSAQALPSLGRNLSGGLAIVGIIEPHTQFEERLTQLDFRLTKIFRVGQGRVQGMFDIYNIFNEDSVLTQTTRYGASYRLPRSVLGGRMFKVGAQVNF